MFCGADEKVEEGYKTLAHNLGEMIAENGYGLVTGGSNTGLMQHVTNGFVRKGNNSENLHGILPIIFKDAGVEHPLIPSINLVWTKSLGVRLEEFHKMSDAVIVLPGGFGTLHELMDFLVKKQFKQSNQPIILINTKDFWQGFLVQVNQMVTEKFLTQSHRTLFTVVNTADEAIKSLENEQPTHQGIDDGYWKK